MFNFSSFSKLFTYYLHIHYVSGRKNLYSAKYPGTDCAIHRLKIQLGAKIVIEICWYQQIIVLALTLVKIFDVLTFHEVLIVNPFMI